MVDLRLICIIQGIACMAGALAMGIATGNKIASWLAIVSVGVGFLSTTAVILDEHFTIPANYVTVVSMVFGAAAILVLLK